MFRPIAALAALAAISAGCSSASATPVDATNDVHCFGLATAFSGFARAQNAPADQRRSTAALEAWYGVKFDAVVRARGRDAVTAEIAPLARAVDANPRAAQEAFLVCMERALAEPAFNAFAAQAGF